MIYNNNSVHWQSLDMTNKDIQLEIAALSRSGRAPESAAKRNALNDASSWPLRELFETLPHRARRRADGEGEHFCAGLDLSELKERDAGQGLHHSRMWHAALERVQYGPVPVVAALHGAVVGGGLELASACHIRVADEPPSTRCPKARAASSWAAAARCAFPS
jgi:enoyl-CoA hydratase/carnithine racemase